MEAKYYTPTLEEFHIGFEYEYMNGDKWEKSEITIQDYKTTGWDYEKQNSWFEEELLGGIRTVRVKYLDQEDIESLGFIRDCERAGYKFFLELENKDQLLLENLSLTTNMSDMFQIKLWHKEKGLYGEDTYYGDILFIGRIKNKSELKKLIQQLNIHD